MKLRNSLNSQQLLAILGIIIFGFSLSFASFHILKDRKKQRENLKFEVAASSSSLTIKRTIETTHNALKSIASLYDSSDYVGRQQFQRFVSSILKDRLEIKVLKWVPKVIHVKRDDYINAAQYDGFSNFELFETDKNGLPIPLKKRDTYYPVFFIEPVKKNKNRLGYDLSSNPDLLKDLHLARDSGQWVVSNVPASAFSTQTSQYIHMIDPVYQFDITNSTLTDRRFYLNGFAIAIIDIKKLMNIALSGMQLDKNFSVYLFDKSASHMKKAVGHYGDQEKQIDISSGVMPEGAQIFDMRIGQRDWSVVVVNHQSFAAGWVTYTSLFLLIGITLFCAYFVYSQFTSHEKVRMLVVERTAELQKHKDHLEDMVKNRTEIIAEQAEELKIQLEKEQELNELQRSFVSMASHEFRTPLAIIDVSAHRLERRAQKGKTDNVELLIEKIHKAVGRMTQLMESTLAVASMDKGKLQISPQECDIKSLLQDCCERQQDIAHYHKISFSLDELPDSIVADPISMDQVFTNLLSNAVKYSPNAPDIQVEGHMEDDMIVISVVDEGIGIDGEDIPMMFSRFFRAKTATGIAGTGIGLNLVKMLIEEHGGKIELTSEPAKGTTFTVYLPIKGPEKSEDDMDRTFDTAEQPHTEYYATRPSSGAA